jgi:hypothetical protein
VRTLAAPRVATSLGAVGVDAQQHLREMVRRNLARWRSTAPEAAAAHGAVANDVAADDARRGPPPGFVLGEDERR